MEQKKFEPKKITTDTKGFAPTDNQELKKAVEEAKKTLQSFGETEEVCSECFHPECFCYPRIRRMKSSSDG